MTGDELRALRRATGLSQAEFGVKLDLTGPYIGELERGEKTIDKRTALAAHHVHAEEAIPYGGREVEPKETDIPLAEAQILWEPDVEGIPPVRVVRVLGRDDRRYACSTGACNGDFSTSGALGQRLWLLAYFHELTTLYRIPARDVHDAFWVIPEYRRSVAPDFLHEAGR